MDAGTFDPAWASPPGTTMGDLLEKRGVTVAEFAEAIGHSKKETSDLLVGAREVTPQVAEQISLILGSSSRFWLTRERQYRDALQRVKQSHDWLKGFPVADLVSLGWAHRADDPASKLHALLRFFGVNTVSDWHHRYDDLLASTTFRSSSAFTSSDGATLSWLRKGEVDASLLNCSIWEKKRFLSLLPELRSLTRTEDPGVFVPELQRLCAECGVAVVVAKAPKGCRASGATRFLSTDQALLLLSFRYLSDDEFWFSFFHEAAHLVLHDTRKLFLEGSKQEDCDSNEEREADTFAFNLLIPVSEQAAFWKLPVDGRAVMRYARQIGISPGVLVGRLQHEKVLTYRQLNNLKRRYKWTGS